MFAAAYGVRGKAPALESMAQRAGIFIRGSNWLPALPGGSNWLPALPGGSDRHPALPGAPSFSIARRSMLNAWEAATVRTNSRWPRK